MTASTVPVLFTVTVKVTLPPGSTTLVGSAVLLTLIVGKTSSIVTVALSDALAALLSSSWTVAVVVEVSLSPALPEIVAM